MNANEIISKIASESLSENIHPNDHVNMSQSSNDVIPTATNVAAVTEIVQNLIPAVESLIQSLDDKAKKWEKVYKNGRTHLMDATPVSLGQEFSGYSALLSERLEDIKLSLINASKLAIGGTAVGTGINAPDNFGKDVAKEISKSLINFFSNTSVLVVKSSILSSRLCAITGNIVFNSKFPFDEEKVCLLYTSPSPRDGLLSRMPSSA